MEVEPYLNTMAAPKSWVSALLGGIIAVLLVTGIVGAAVHIDRSSGRATPVALINAAPSKTADGGTAHFTTSVAITISGLNEGSLMTTGDADFTNKDSQMTLSSDGLSSTVRLVSRVEYFQSSVIPLPNGAQWVKILPQDLGVTATKPSVAGGGDPTQGLQFLGSTIGTPTILGHQNVAGASTTHYSVVFDLASLFARVSQAGSTISPSFAQQYEALSSKVDLAHIPGNVWLDSAGRVRQFNYTLAFQAAGVSFSEVATTTFSDFGLPVHVTVPPASETVPFSAVKKEFAQALSPPGAVA